MEGRNFPRPDYRGIPVDMEDQEKTVVSRKGKRGPAPTGKGTPIMLRLQPDLLAWVDSERAKLGPEPSRPEFIRQLIEKAKQ